MFPLCVRCAPTFRGCVRLLIIFYAKQKCERKKTNYEYNWIGNFGVIVLLIHRFHANREMMPRESKQTIYNYKPPTQFDLSENIKELLLLLFLFFFCSSISVCIMKLLNFTFIWNSTAGRYQYLLWSDLCCVWLINGFNENGFCFVSSVCWTWKCVCLCEFRVQCSTKYMLQIKRMGAY